MQQLTTRQRLQQAAAMAYYASVALAPAALAGLALLAILLDLRPSWYQTLLDRTVSLGPGQEEAVAALLQELIEVRWPTAAVGVLGLLWALSGLADVATTALRDHEGEPRKERGRPGRSLRWPVGLLTALLALSLISGVALDLTLRQGLLPQEILDLGLFPWLPLKIATVWPLALLPLLGFFCLYRFGRPSPGAWRWCAVGATIAALGLVGSTAFLAWFGGRTGEIHLLFRLPAAIILFLIWLYLGCLLFVIGAGLSPALPGRGPALAPTPRMVPTVAASSRLAPPDPRPALPWGPALGALMVAAIGIEALSRALWQRRQ